MPPQPLLDLAWKVAVNRILELRLAPAGWSLVARLATSGLAPAE